VAFRPEAGAMDQLTDNKFLFSFEGRINRFKYWYALFASGIFCLVLMLLLAFVIGGILGADVKSIHIQGHVLDVFQNPPSFPFSASFGDADATPHAALIALIFHVAGTPILIFGIWFLAATTIKRLHDRNKSGWWIIAFFVAPALLNGIADALDDSNTEVLLLLVAVSLNLWGFFELLLLKGTRGPNRFGPDPLAPTETRAPEAPRGDQQSEPEFIPHSAGPSPGAHVMRGHD
jgi:uncharacterized membrane protein YhaH (DUF805 family)